MTTSLQRKLGHKSDIIRTLLDALDALDSSDELCDGPAEDIYEWESARLEVVAHLKNWATWPNSTLNLRDDK